MPYLKIDNIQDFDETKAVITVNGVAVLANKKDIVDSPHPQEQLLPAHVLQALTDIRVSTRAIEHWAVGDQLPDLGHQPQPSTPMPVGKPPEREATKTKSVIDIIAPPKPFKDIEVREQKEQLFQVNEEAEHKVDMRDFARNLNHNYIENPKTRRTVIKRVAGMVRLDMLRYKEEFCPELRRAVVGNLLRRASLKPAIVPPDLAACLDDRPLSETLGSRQWDPGSDQAKDNVSANWANSQKVMDDISNRTSDDEFSHMYASTEDMDIQSMVSNAKNLFGSGS